MLGNGLPGKFRTLGELGNRIRLPATSFATSNRRVSSPNAANNGARLWCRCATWLSCLRHVTLDVFHLFRPAAIISTECFEPAVTGNLVETRFGKQQ